MNLILDSLRGFQSNLTQFTHGQLSRLDFALVSPTAYDLVHQIVRTLVYSPLVYEASVVDRLAAWFTPLTVDNVDGNKGSVMTIFTVGCLSTTPFANVIMSDFEPKVLRWYLVAVALNINTNYLPNFPVVYDLQMACVLDCGPSRAANAKKVSLVCEIEFTPLWLGVAESVILGVDSSKLPVLTLTAWLADKKNPWNATEFMSYFLQIIASLGLLSRVTKGQVAITDLLASDLILVPSALSEISYGSFVVRCYGRVVKFANLNKFNLLIPVNTEAYKISDDKVIPNLENNVLGNIVFAIINAVPHKSLLELDQGDVYAAIRGTIASIVSARATGAVEAVAKVLSDNKFFLDVYAPNSAINQQYNIDTSYVLPTANILPIPDDLGAGIGRMLAVGRT